jgi:hypothetical protein
MALQFSNIHRIWAGIKDGGWIHSVDNNRGWIDPLHEGLLALSHASDERKHFHRLEAGQSRMLIL